MKLGGGSAVNKNEKTVRFFVSSKTPVFRKFYDYFFVENWNLHCQHPSISSPVIHNHEDPTLSCPGNY